MDPPLGTLGIAESRSLHKDRQQLTETAIDEELQRNLVAKANDTNGRYTLN